MPDDSPLAPLASASLPATERRHAGSHGLAEMPTLDVLRLMNAEDMNAVRAVSEALPHVALLVDAAADSIRSGGTVHYFGAGTSGRLGVLDAVELWPTFNIDERTVVAHMAGGPGAIERAVEGAEDDDLLGAADASGVHAADVAIGITASGTTPYVLGALTAARASGAVTALVTSNPSSPLAPLADHLIVTDTGPEVLTGSTRLKSGTAHKLVLNSFSTALMVRLDRTWSNLMVSVVATNAKLRDRALRILIEATGLDRDAAQHVLADCDGGLKAAIVSVLAGTDPATAARTLASHGSSVSGALAALRDRSSSPLPPDTLPQPPLRRAP